MVLINVFCFHFLLLFYAVYKRKSLLGRPAAEEMKRVMTMVTGGLGMGLCYANYLSLPV